MIFTDGQVKVIVKVKADGAAAEMVRLSWQLSCGRSRGYLRSCQVSVVTTPYSLSLPKSPKFCQNCPFLMFPDNNQCPQPVGELPKNDKSPSFTSASWSTSQKVCDKLESECKNCVNPFRNLGSIRLSPLSIRAESKHLKRIIKIKT